MSLTHVPWWEGGQRLLSPKSFVPNSCPTAGRVTRTQGSAQTQQGDPTVGVRVQLGPSCKLRAEKGPGQASPWTTSHFPARALGRKKVKPHQSLKPSCHPTGTAHPPCATATAPDPSSSSQGSHRETTSLVPTAFILRDTDIYSSHRAHHGTQLLGVAATEPSALASVAELGMGPSITATRPWDGAGTRRLLRIGCSWKAFLGIPSPSCPHRPPAPPSWVLRAFRDVLWWMSHAEAQNLFPRGHS